MTPRAIPAFAAALLAASAAQAGEPRLAFDVRADFVRHDPSYVADRKAARAPLPALTAGVRALEAVGDSDETATYFAVGWLGELGVFDSAKSFWTRRDIPDGPALGSRIAARIRDALAHGRGADGGVYYRNALARLAADGVR